MARRDEPAGGNWSLLEKLIDSQLEWRQLICEANGGEGALRQLSELQIKRQEVIHELVQTERHHCLTLALMRQVYLSGLKRLNELRCEQHHSQLAGAQKLAPAGPAPAEHPGDLIDLERLFPALEELVQAHELFFAHLRLRLADSCGRREEGALPLVGLVGRLGELLSEQFTLKAAPAKQDKGNRKEPPAPEKKNAKGHKLLAAYGKFCGQQLDSSRYYKHLMQSDKGFKQFIEQCNKQHPACRQRGIPECNLLVTQRLTKYPLLIDQLIKTSKDDPEEEQKLREALAECKALLAELNNQLARKESFERLLGIYAQFCPKSYTIYNRHLKFTKHDLLQHKRLRQLVHSDGQLRIWSAQRRKLFQVLCLILNDIIVFLRLESSSSPAGQQQQQAVAEAAAAAEQDAPANILQHHLSDLALDSAGSQEQVGSMSQSALINVVASALQSNQPSLASSASGQQASGAPNFKYYFANIDQKSSVISLSKLLIREKAANDQDGPRVYLISSSPRQPEMYELAFVSRRHQLSFVDKLKACVEQHTRSLLEGEAEDVINEHEDELAGPFWPEACCTRQFCAGGHRQSSEEEEGEDDDDDGEDEEEAPRRSELDFQLDIEQDVILPGQEESLSSETEAERRRKEEACSSGSLAEEPKRAEGPQEEEELLEADEMGSHESGLSERARDSLDESSSLGKKVRLNQRRRRAHRPRNVSNQSSSSSEAAHRQAIQMISGEPFAARTEEDFDSGRGHDSSSSAASISSSSLEPEKEKERAKSGAEVAPEAASALQACDGAAKAPSGASPGKLEESLAGGQPRTSNLVKCSSVLSKSTSMVKQQRKLSTVSTMSSQLKLLTKFKAPSSSSSNLRQSPSHNEQHLCAPCNQHSPTGSLLCAKQARQQMRRSTFIPEQKLEELRDLRIQLDKDKQEWQAKFDRMQEQLLNERRELDLAREKLKQDKQQVADEREQLYRKLNVLKEKGILLSPSHKVIITSPNAAAMMYQQQQQYIADSNNSQQQQAPIISFAANQRHPQQAFGDFNNSVPPTRLQIHQQPQPLNNALDARQATNLFIQNSQLPTNPKVPLHLSEQGQTGTSAGSISTAQRVTSSFGLNKFPPLMQVLGGGISLIGSPSVSAKPSNNDHQHNQYLI